MNLIDDWRDWWRWASSWVGAIYAAVMAVILVDPAQLLWLFNALPFQLRKYLPEWLQLLVAFAVFFGAFWTARVKTQGVKSSGVTSKDAKLRGVNCVKN